MANLDEKIGDLERKEISLLYHRKVHTRATELTRRALAASEVLWEIKSAELKKLADEAVKAGDVDAIHKLTAELREAGTAQIARHNVIMEEHRLTQEEIADSWEKSLE